MQKILYVEDDLSLIDGLQYTLEASGYMVDNAKTVKEALALFRKNTYDLLLLDVTLPDGTGFDVCKAVRNSSTVPIIFLTASDQEISIVRGLDMGADDYITKPFKLNELLSRIKAILRRSLQFSKADTFLEANGVRVDTAERLVWKNEKPLDLPLVEYKLLCLFMQNPNHLMPREMILDRMWDGNGNFVDDNTLSVYIRRLRNKIEDTPKDDISLNCDALWMSEAIGNIVKNALEHTQPGGHISVQWTQSPLLTQIVITDDGKGIHQEDLYNIFKRFYRSRFSSDVHGIGLGLPLAKSIVEAHGGTISVTSTLDVGTTFTLNFFSLTNE